MAESDQFNIPESILAEFRCELCKRYLSSAPIQVLSSGRSICSDCSVSTAEPSCCRNLTLEALLSKLSFPCQFHDHGCQARLPFGTSKAHEPNCDYRNFACPMFTDNGCSWQGSTVELLDHFSKAHPGLAKTSGAFKLDVLEDKREILMFSCDEVGFIMKYVFCANSTELRYDIRRTKFNVHETSCKIRLSNDSDGDYSYTTKIEECPLYNSNFQDMPAAHVLTLSTYFKMLGNPARIAFSVNVSVTTVVPDVTHVNDGIQTACCQKCYGCLVPPIYCGPSGVVCSSCHKRYGNSQLIKDAELEEYASKAIVFCSWQGCQFAAKKDDIQQHERACEFRLCKCSVCEKDFLMKNAMTHLTSHQYEYFFNSCRYRIPAGRNPNKKIFTVKDNELVVIHHSTGNHVHYKGSYRIDEYRHMLSMNATGSDAEISVKVQFEHSHCTVKSKTFTVASSDLTSIYVKDFPDCFQFRDELVVTLKV